MQNAFSMVLRQLETLTNNAQKSVSKIDYDKFCNEFIFEKIKGKSFGEAFCERFNLNNIFLKDLSDDMAKYHIKVLGYIK